MPSIEKLLKNPYKAVFILDKYKISKLIPDKLYLKMKFRACMGQKLSLKDPRTFNEKLNWLKLYNRNPEYTKMVDKYEAKEYVAKILGNEYIIPTLGVWDSVEDIDFEALPEQFVLKCTHDSGGLVICRDKSKFDIDNAKNILRKALKSDFYFLGREWPYKNVKKRIIAEQYMEDPEIGELRDYKFLCCDGEMKCSFVCSHRFSEKGLHVTFLDKDWNVMPLERHYPSLKEGIEPPKNYDRMIQLAEVLSRDIPFVRVDFYEVKGQIYFGELTFFPGCGWEEFTPHEWDYKFGEWINLPEKRQ